MGIKDDAVRRLHLSNRSGWRVWTQRTVLRAMDWVWPLANWVSATFLLGSLYGRYVRTRQRVGSSIR